METKQKDKTESVTLFFPKDNTENFTYDGKVLEFIMVDDKITAAKLEQAEIYFSATDLDNNVFFLIDIGGEIDLKFVMPINLSVYTDNIIDKIEKQDELEFRLTVLTSDYSYASEKNAMLSEENSMQLKNIFLRQWKNQISYSEFIKVSLNAMDNKEYEIMTNPFMREIFYGKNQEIYEA